MTISKKLWIGIVVLAILSPIGLILPDHFKAGPAWGEWGAEEMQNLVGYVPQGFKKLAVFWNAPLENYAFRGGEGKGLEYIFSAIIGIASIVGIVLWMGKKITKGKD